eukprot:169481-Chlamydomonas_euryale.AAC.1
MTGLACLQCLECEDELGASNSSRTAQEHFGVGEPTCHAKKSADAKVSRTLKRTTQTAELGVSAAGLHPMVCVPW